VKLSDQQYEFGKDVILLLMFLHRNGIKYSLGECWRRPETQKILHEKGYSNVDKGGHQDKLAIDIFMWLNGKFMEYTWENRDRLIFVGDFWKSLNQLNVWGGDWTIHSKPDLVHFERKRV
jgi:hypothetical protein